MSTVFFTCLSRALWEDYAQHTLKTWEKLGAKVVVFSEDDLSDVLPAFIEWRPIGQEAIDFQKSLTGEVKREAFPRGSYCYRKDIAKFAWPVFAWANAIRMFPKSVWMDADVAVKVPPPESLIFPEGAEVSYLGRTKHPQEYPYTESGLIGFDIKNPEAAARFASEMTGMLTSGEIYNFPQWHDCVILDESMKRHAESINFKSISKDDRVDHVFDLTLSEWLHHYRGPARKKQAHLGERGMKTNNW